MTAKHAPAAKQLDTRAVRLDDRDLYLFNEGTHHRLYRKLGAHPVSAGEETGTHFAVWAPNAARVSVVGDFNGWRAGDHPLEPVAGSGIWHGFVPGVEPGSLYKYAVEPARGGPVLDKTDPFAFQNERSPKTASVVCDLRYQWRDEAWMRERGERQRHEAPVSIYEVHLGSWQRDPSDPDRHLSCGEIAPRLAEHATRLGFSHVELLPIMEHPFYGSWGYQTTGYFAPTTRYGTPQDLMALIDTLHQAGIGVILDWVPSHFPTDAHGLGNFDGTHLFEHSDPRQGFHPDWQSYIFNYGRNEVCSFLFSSALFWLDHYHADGLRVDAVASMLYLNYSRSEGEWIPNIHGGNENLEAIDFLRRLNETVYGEYPDVQTYAEESTSWPMVSRPTYLGGLGFGYKWDMGWMHDTLHYMQNDPVHRRYHHNELTFRMVYAFTESFVLPLSHDEVVHGKGSLLGKMPGDASQRYANLRLLYGYMYTQPGKKLLFMGGEFAQEREWAHDHSLDWHLMEDPAHEGILRWVADLNSLYRRLPQLHVGDCSPEGFEWIDAGDAENSVYSYLRHGPGGEPPVAVVINATPVPRHRYRLGVPKRGRWHELLNSDSEYYGGGGVGNFGAVGATPIPYHGRSHSLVLSLPPLSVLVLSPAEPA